MKQNREESESRGPVVSGRQAPTHPSEPQIVADGLPAPLSWSVADQSLVSPKAADLPVVRDSLAV